MVVLGFETETELNDMVQVALLFIRFCYQLGESVCSSGILILMNSTEFTAIIGGPDLGSGPRCLDGEERVACR